MCLNFTHTHAFLLHKATEAQRSCLLMAGPSLSPVYTSRILRNICDEARCLYLLPPQKAPQKILSITAAEVLTQMTSAQEPMLAKITHREGT